MTSTFLQLLINGLVAGSIYALIASGFSLIYSTNKFVHFAHGGVISISAYILYLLFSKLGIDFYLAAFLTIVSSAVIGYIINKIIYAPLRKKNASSSVMLVASLGVLILIESLNLLFFGAELKTIQFITIKQGLNIFGASITPLQLFIVFISMSLFVGLYFFMKRSRIGMAMRAVADNKNIAEIVGISSEKIYQWSFIIGSGIAGVAAILISLEQNIQPTMGTSLIIKGFTGAIIGGIGSVPGAVLGSLLLGFTENLGTTFLLSGYKDAIAFILLFLFLLYRPQGIWGIKNIRK
jgi:branched-chain amino acid transport system permease protein